MKTALKFILILAVAAFLVVSMIRLFGTSSDMVCSGIELEIEDSMQTNLIEKTEIEGILKKNKMNFKDKPAKDINLALLEKTISNSPYVDTACARFNASCKLVLTVIPRKPAMHVMAKNGEEYYLDRNGATLPIGNLKGNLIIATGNIGKKFAEQKLAPLARCLQDSDFWRSQAQQIDVVNEHDVRLYTRVADHYIRLGDPDSIPDKLHRLRIFYEQGLPKTGWNKYECISVEYQGIVIGTKKNKNSSIN